MGVKSYRELIAWQKAMDLSEAVYRATAEFPKQEQYGLTIQLRRAAVSIPSSKISFLPSTNWGAFSAA